MLSGDERGPTGGKSECWTVRTVLTALFLTLLPLLLPGHAVADDRPVLRLPIVCEPHRTCFIQNYVDVDPGKDAKDYACGSATYDGHSGVDFRLLSAEAAKSGVAVVAAADGVVKARRDGTRDVFYQPKNPGDVEGHECGNGVIIDHGGGWETQYCHMREGSLRVIKGQSVKGGDKLGEVGYSGLASFAHLHFTVRKSGNMVDPFLPDGETGTCSSPPKGPGLWEPQAAAAFPYMAGEIIAAGFAGAPPSADAMEADDRSAIAINPTTEIIFAYARLINLRKGDQIRLTSSGPNGTLAERTSEPLDRDKASYLSYSGAKKSAAVWPTGRYEARVEVLRDGSIIATKVATVDLQ